MRNYIADLPGGTATTSIQIQSGGTIKNLFVSMLNAAVGKVEISTNATAQIGTAQPAADVALRINNSATAANLLVVASVSITVKAFQTLYIHQTGAGNVGSITFRV